MSALPSMTLVVLVFSRMTRYPPLRVAASCCVECNYSHYLMDPSIWKGDK
jgi:hypothetical protein